MTREEAKDVFLNRGFIEVEDCRGRIFHADKWREACVVISEWLEQEPCENAISRQAVKEQMLKYGFHAPDMTVIEFVEDILPVNPQPKIGHWINNQNGTYTCDKCGGKHSRSNYCPICGVKMKEVEE